MEELIKEAEKLYKNIDETQSHLIKARLDKDRIREHLELIGLETIVFDAKQLLKCIIDRKDNIVDLSEVWHKYNPKQEICDDIIACYKDNLIFNVHSQNEIDILLRHNRHLEGKIYFAFVKDLLPKGGEEWKRFGKP